MVRSGKGSVSRPRASRGLVWCACIAWTCVGCAEPPDANKETSERWAAERPVFLRPLIEPDRDASLGDGASQGDGATPGGTVIEEVIDACRGGSRALNGWSSCQRALHMDIVCGVVRHEPGVDLHRGATTTNDPAMIPRLRQRTRVLLAMLPAPWDPGLRYLHNSMVEGLRLAIERGGFTARQQRLPWEMGASRGDGGAAPSAADCREEVPGVMVFQRDRGGDTNKPVVDTILVLLVAENPRTGPREAVLGEAMALARIFRDEAQRTVILGPAFSGSAERMVDLLRADAPPAGYLFLNGSATDSAVGDRLVGEGRLARSAFCSMTVTDRELEQRFYEYLQRTEIAPEGCALPNVAMLQESGTGYGVASLDEARDAVDESKRGRCQGPLRPEVQLTFPHQIAALRTAYDLQQRQRSAALRDPIRDPLTHLFNLEPTLADTDDAHDATQAPSGLTVLAQDLGLTQLLAEVAHEGIRYLGIKATDPADIVFLARRIRDVAPDIRLFLLYNDQLLSHPEYRSDLLGTFVITPYPFLGTNALSPAVQDWAFRETNGGVLAEAVAHAEHRHLSLANSSAEGIFNAATVAIDLLTHDAAINPIEYAPFHPRAGVGEDPVHRDPRVACLPESERAFLAPPSVWIAAVGNTGLVPLAAMRSEGFRSSAGASAATASAAWDAADDQRQLQVDPDPDVIPPRSTQYLTVLVTLLGMWMCVRHLRDHHQIEVTRARTHRRLAAFIYMNLESAALLMTIATLVVLQVAARAVYPHQPHALRVFELLATAVGVCLLTVQAILAGALVRSLRREAQAEAVVATSHDEGAPRWQRSLARLEGAAQPTFGRAVEWLRRTLWALAFAAVWCSMGASCLVLAVALVRPLSAVHNLTVLGDNASQRWISPERVLSLRALPLFNGVSPAAPLLLLFAAIGMGAFARRMRNTEYLLYLPLSQSKGTGQGRGALSRTLGEDLVEEGRFDVMGVGLMYGVVVGVVVGILGITAMFFPLRSLELRSISYLLFAVMLLTAALGSTLVYRLWSYWAALEPLLRRLSTHPLGAAFERVAPALVERLEQQLTRQRDDITRMAVCVECLRTVLSYIDRASAETKREIPSSALRRHLEVLTRRLADARAARATLRVWDLRPWRGGFARQYVAMRWSLGYRVAPVLVEAARDCVALLRPRWGYCDPAPMSWDTAGLTKDQSGALDALAGVMETYVASVLTTLVNRLVRPVRWLFFGVVSMGLLMILAVSSYPFQPRRLVLFFAWTTVLSVSGGTFGVYVQMDRNTVLSRIARTTPGRISFDFAFFTRLFTLVVLPLLSLVAVQFPQVIRVVYEVLAPFARAVR